MQGGASKSSRQSLEVRAVALLSQDVDRLSKAAQDCIPAGELSQAADHLAALASKLHEVEELLREIERTESQPPEPTGCTYCTI